MLFFFFKFITLISSSFLIRENWYNFSNISSTRKRTETQWHAVKNRSLDFPLFPLLLIEESISSHALVNQSWLILPLVETWWFGRHSSRLRRYNLNGFSVATAGIDWNGLRSDAVIFSDRWTNAELAPAGFEATIFLSRRSPAFQRFVG